MDYHKWKHLFVIVFCLLAVRVWSAPEVVVRSEAISLRTAIAGDKMGALVQPGQRLVVLNKIGRWYYIQTRNNDVGWIFEQNVELDLETYTPIDTRELSPQQVYALTSREITIGGQLQTYQWSADRNRIVFQYRTEYEETVVKTTNATIDEELVTPVFTSQFAEPKFLPQNQKVFSGGMSLSADSEKLVVGNSPMNLLFLDENLEIQRRERIKVRNDVELYGGVSFSPKSDRIAFYNLVSEELDGLVNNLCLITVPGLEYEIITKMNLDWNETPVWAPDGLSFLYGGEGKIYLVDVDLKISEFADGYHFNFSPDGETVVYSRDEEIYFRRVGRFLERRKTFGQYPSWHPTGRMFAYENEGGIWLEETVRSEKKRMLPNVSRPIMSPMGNMFLCQSAIDSLKIVYLGEVLDINYVYRLNLGHRDGLAEGMLLSVYRPQLGLRDQTVGYNQESWQGFIRIISTQERTALVKQEKLTRVIGREEVVVLPTLEKLGRLTRLTTKQVNEQNKTQLVAGRR